MLSSKLSNLEVVLGRFNVLNLAVKEKIEVPFQIFAECVQIIFKKGHCFFYNYFWAIFIIFFYQALMLFLNLFFKVVIYVEPDHLKVVKKFLSKHLPQMTMKTTTDLGLVFYLFK